MGKEFSYNKLLLGKLWRGFLESREGRALLRAAQRKKERENAKNKD